MKNTTVNSLLSLGMLLIVMGFSAEATPAGNANPNAEKVIEALISDHDNDQVTGFVASSGRTTGVFFEKQ